YGDVVIFVSINGGYGGHGWWTRVRVWWFWWWRRCGGDQKCVGRELQSSQSHGAMFTSFGRGHLGISREITPRMHRIMQDINIVDGTSEDFPLIISSDTHMILYDLKLDVVVFILISLCLKKVGKWEIVDLYDNGNLVFTF
ncbi:hypothetical protein Tco_0092930, partial [Tanacetum coccineum]